MSKSVYELIFDLTILAILVFFVAKAFTLSGGAGRVPLFVGIPTLILMAAKIAVSLFKQFSSAPRTSYTGDSEPGAVNRKILNEIMWLFIFTVLIIFLGVVYGSVVFLLLYLRLHNNDSWLFTIVVCIAVVITTYVVFQELLKMFLYEGVIPGMISEWFDY